MRLSTMGFEVGVPVDGEIPGLHPTAFDELNADNPRSGDYALKVNSETGVPTGSSTDVVNPASLARMWSPVFQRASTQDPVLGGAETYYLRRGFIIRAAFRFNTGDLPSSGKAVEFIRVTDMPDSSLYGRTALCIASDGKLHWKGDARLTLAPTAGQVASTIVPQGFLITPAIDLDEWHVAEIAFTPHMEAVRIDGTLVFTRCHGGTNTLRPSPGFGWNVVYAAGAVVTSSGGMGSDRDVYFDDVAINDVYDDGSGQDGFPGDGRVQVVRPAADLGAGYSWAPGGPQSIWDGAPNGTFGDAVAGTPHPQTPPPTPPYYPALRLIPMHTPDGDDYGANATWTGAFSGLPMGYGIFLNETNPYEDGVNCPYPPLPHDGIWYPGERNFDAFGIDAADYMVTSGASDWRAQAGVGRLGTFPPGVFHPDTEFIYPRADGGIADALELECDFPSLSGTVLLAIAWIYNPDAVGGRAASVPRTGPEAALTPGLKTWLPDIDSEPADKTYVGSTLVQFQEPVFAPTIANPPPLTIKNVTSIGPSGTDAFQGAAARPVYGAGIIVEDMSAGGDPLPDTCTALMILV